MSLPEFGCGEWVELAEKMFDFTGGNVFVIGTVGEAPNILLTKNDLRNVPTDVLGRPTPVRPRLTWLCDAYTPVCCRRQIPIPLSRR